MFNVVSDNIFNCIPWNDSEHITVVKGLKIIVSDIVFGNISHSTIQMHIAIKSREKVIKTHDLTQISHTISSKQVVEQFERTIRESVIDIVTWKGESPDDGLVKIWYLRPENDSVRDDQLEPFSDLYLRVAVTVVDICLLDSLTEQRLTNEVKSRLRICISEV